jgi:DNA-binding transcriptional ArsR family regulator
MTRHRHPAVRSTATRPRYAETALAFAALGDETRLRLVTRLSREGPLSITQLATGAAVTRQAITKHLEALEHARIAESCRGGRERIWQLHPERLDEVRLHLQQISDHWDAAINRLRALVEEEEP